VGQGWQRERGERERFLIKILKAEIELKKRVFLEKAFQHPIKSRKLSWISTKTTLIDFDLLNHSNSNIMSKRRFIHNCLMKFSFKRKTSRNDLNTKVKEEITFLK
jgi:hypothetical protein